MVGDWELPWGENEVPADVEERGVQFAMVGGQSEMAKKKKAHEAG